MNETDTENRYVRIARAIDHIVSATEAGEEAPGLAALAREAGYEPTYFQKLFTAYTGLSPAQMTRFMRYQTAFDLLVQGYSTLDAAYAAGMSGQGRLHDTFVTIAAVTPGTAAGRGRGLNILFGFAPTLLGEVLLAKTDRGLCYAGFTEPGGREAALADLQARWPCAYLHPGDIIAEGAVIDSVWRGAADDGRKTLPLHLFGTNMQIQVWQALLRIPMGAALTYGSVAAAIDNPKASRAVGAAVGSNPLTLLIPCHRVIRASGIVHNYAWGNARKKLILGLEAENRSKIARA